MVEVVASSRQRNFPKVLSQWEVVCGCRLSPELRVWDADRESRMRCEGAPALPALEFKLFGVFSNT